MDLYFTPHGIESSRDISYDTWANHNNNNNNRIRKTLLTGNRQTRLVAKGAFAFHGAIQFVRQRIVNDGDERPLVDEQRNRHARVRNAVHEIARAVDRVDDPRRSVGKNETF